jgi:hypothetical protein
LRPARGRVPVSYPTANWVAVTRHPAALQRPKANRKHKTVSWRMAILSELSNSVPMGSDRSQRMFWTVGIARGYWLDGPGSKPQRPDRLWGPPSLLSNGYRGPFPRG